MSIENALDRFISSETPRAAILQGTWGRGKTHLWKARWEHCTQSKNSPLRGKKYAYVSLFGLDSMAELRMAIWLASSLHIEQESNERAWFGTRWRKSAAKKTKAAFTKLDIEIPYLGSLSGLSQFLINDSIKDMLVCLDDIERRGENLRLLDVLGLVSELNVHRACSVIVILNDGSLGNDLEVWNSNREKVFHQELCFEPSSEQCVALVIPPDALQRELRFTRQAVIDLGITNIRIITRALDNVADIFSGFESDDLHDAVAEKLCRSIALITFCHLGAGEDAPSLDFAFSHGTFSSYIADRETEQEPTELRWRKLLDGYGHYLDHPFDPLLANFVRSGVSDIAKIRDNAFALNDTAFGEDVVAEYRCIWSKWRNSFKNNRDEVAQEFLDIFPRIAPILSANDADSVFQLLRSFGASDQVDVLIEQWLNHRRGERSNELNPDFMGEFGQIRDSAFRDRAAAAHAEVHKELPELGATLEKMGRQDGHNPEDIEALAVATPAEIAAFLDATESGAVVRGLKDCLRFDDSHGSEYAQMNRNIRHALLMLAARSKFEADRIERLFGVGAGDGDWL